jgi:hypothetical protein
LPRKVRSHQPSRTKPAKTTVETPARRRTEAVVNQASTPIAAKAKRRTTTFLGRRLTNKIICM